MELKIEAQARGVRIITGDQAVERRKLLNQLIEVAESEGFKEIILPSLEPSKVYILPIFIQINEVTIRRRFPTRILYPDSSMGV